MFYDRSFKERSYGKSAAKEILELIINTHFPPLVVLEDYMNKMYEFAKVDARTSEMFLIGGETAEYFIGLLT